MIVLKIFKIPTFFKTIREVKNFDTNIRSVKNVVTSHPMKAAEVCGSALPPRRCTRGGYAPLGDARGEK
jgi:hypothetical protein